MSNDISEPFSEDCIESLASTLCKECDRLLQHAASMRKDCAVVELKLERLWGEIRQSAKQCRLCRSILREEMPFQPPDEDSSMISMSPKDYNQSISSGAVGYWLSVFTKSGCGGSRIVPFYPVHEKKSPIPQFLTDYEYASRTDAPSVAQLVRQWYDQCISNHTQCDHPKNKYQPPRLLEVKSDSFRLVIPNEPGLSYLYATLSHCWGSNSHFLKLTSSNIDAMMQWAPVENLPTTFRDAVRLCCRIDIHYLWIDSLCIIQEGRSSEADWSDHVSRMSAIYSNGALNIAASCSSGPWGGLHTLRDPGMLKPAIIRGGHDYGLSEDIYWIGGEKNINAGVLFSPLNLRGWVFQERLLSPRVVHFESEQVFWECNSGEMCETYPCGGNSRKSPYSSLTNFALPTSAGCSGIVENYSRCKLSFPEKDKLAAFAGVARKISQYDDDKYYAGLFKSSLPGDLLWHNANKINKVTEANKKRPNTGVLLDDRHDCPSWSWAKIDAPICYTCPVGPYLVTIRDVQMMPVDSNSHYGPVSGGYMILRGFLLDWDWDMIAGTEPPKCHFDTEILACIDPQDLRILPFGFVLVNDSPSKAIIMISLILQKLDGKTQEEYNRVGWLQFTWATRDRSPLAKSEEGDDDPKANTWLSKAGEEFQEEWNAGVYKQDKVYKSDAWRSKAVSAFREEFRARGKGELDICIA
ncbi:HET-domain-containing protein [Aaosphaeria arxii CBS 175.79]|uniref:HET-domain-containing protein n=1 Tax=Aaosphaeria arxii CBS 175.79 TaxID=1450172 RepID=A0A6A5XME2_9PLEO|nr:HET-domain-containing protein [Aaosphaeria arxii CBS 175.79]KAF2013981.1 HET-domain-containing protein [Aaosphaeria arxii CBS 175.79]